MGDLSLANATLADIRRMLNRESAAADLLDDFDAFAAGTILASGALLTPGALALLGPLSASTAAGRRLIAWFTERTAPSALVRYQRLAAAHKLLVYTAFFEAAQIPLRIVHPKFELAGDEREALLAEGELKDPWDTLAVVPHPAVALDDQVASLHGAYLRSTEGLRTFLEQLDEVRALDPVLSDQLAQALLVLPHLAAETYRAQYLDLMATSERFAVWVERHEQRGLDLGLKRLQAAVHEYAEAMGAKTDAVLDALAIRYARRVAEPIVDDAPALEGDLCFPTRAEAFVPQAFQLHVVSGTRPAKLESEADWAEREVQDDLTATLAAYFDAPHSAEAPLLILGQPGSGKSLLTEMLAAKLATPQFNVVRIALRDVDVTQSLRSLLAAHLQEVSDRDDMRWRVFSMARPETPPLLLLDGFDEVLQTTGRIHARFLEDVRAFQRDEADEGRPVRVVVTSRITLIDKTIVPVGTTVLRLQEFDAARRDAWIATWNRHNAEHFERAGVEPFALPDDEEVTRLAAQPLLLLMLALYDSGPNRLRHAVAAGLERTGLYDDLLRNFIHRERVKGDRSAAFQLLKDAGRDAAIDADMQRLRVVALGMHNRRTLHVDGPQLDADLEHFGCAPEPSGEDTELALSPGERVLGSFFFVHESQTRTADDGRAAKSFEFLHNTFGEFLTADFMTNALLAAAAGSESHRTRDTAPDRWPTAFMHVPLFERPVVLQLLGESIARQVRLRGLDAEALAANLAESVDGQLDDILDGESACLSVQDSTPFLAEPLLTRSAIYTANLLLVHATVATVLDQSWAVDPGRLRNLGLLWRMPWYPETLSAFTNLLADRPDEKRSVEVRHNQALPSLTTDLGGLAHAADVLNDDHAAHVGLIAYDELPFGAFSDLALDPLADGGLMLSLALRGVRADGWRPGTFGADELADFIKDIGFPELLSPIGAEVFALLDDPDTPAHQAESVYDLLLGVTEWTDVLLAAPDPVAIALIRLMNREPATVYELVDWIRKNGLTRLEAHPRTCAELVRLVRRSRHAEDVALLEELARTTEEPEILAALAGCRGEAPLSQVAEHAAERILAMEADGQRVLSRVSPASLRDLVEGADAAPPLPALRTWLGSIADAPATAPLDVWHRMLLTRRGRRRVDRGSVNTPSFNLAMTRSAGARRALLHLFASDKAETLSWERDEANLVPISLTARDVEDFPLGGVKDALCLGPEVLGTEAYDKLVELVEQLKLNQHR